MDGYDYGNVEASPVTMSELEELRQSVLFGEDDVKALRMAGEVLEDQVEDVLDVWYGFVGSHPFLLASFAGGDGEPNADYLERVRARFGQWIRDTCRRAYDDDWLAWQHEIGLRHSRAKKNRTDGVEDAPTPVPLRFVIALIYPISVTIRPFLAKQGHSADDVEAMWQAWFKAVTLQVALWSRAYPDERDW
jgi:hypothetical protein